MEEKKKGGGGRLLMTDDRFGWTNASYVYGLSLMSLHAKRALGVNASYEVYAEAVRRATPRLVEKSG